MISIIFTNRLGTIKMGGYFHPTHKVLEITGLSLPELTRNTAKYYDEPGQLLLYERAEPRTVTMNIEVTNHGRAAQETARMADIMREEGRIIIKTQRRTRCINARCTSFDIAVRNALFRRVVIQFICDYPYFRDEENSIVYVYSKQNLLTSPFVLSTIFSSRSETVAVTNRGDIDTEPIIHIFGTGQNTDYAADEIITVTNTTTGQSLKFTYSLDFAETLTADIPNRRIYSSKDTETNLYCISDDTFLSDFVLHPGVNNIVVTADSKREAAVTLEFNNSYAEAIV